MSKGLFQRFGVILRNNQALKWSYLQPTYLSSRSLTNGLLKSEENIFNFQRNTASILPSQNTMLSYGFCRSFSTSCSLSIKRGYKQENWSFEEMDRRMQKYNGYLTKQSRPRSWMNGKPQIKGVVVKLKIRKPKKPNSANRKCCIVRLSNGKKVIAFIPGEGHNLTEHSVVLVDGHRKKDLVSVHYSVIRGALDCAHVVKKSPDGA